MKRTEFKRKLAMIKRDPNPGWPSQPRTPIAPRSKTKKRRREQAEGPSMAELRPKLYERCGGRCEWCVKPVEYETFEAHHRKLRSRGGLDDLANLVALCTDCHHRRVHLNPRSATRRGFMVSAADDPRLVPLSMMGGWFYLTVDGNYVRTHNRDTWVEE